MKLSKKEKGAISEAILRQVSKSKTERANKLRKKYSHPELNEEDCLRSERIKSKIGVWRDER